VLDAAGSFQPHVKLSSLYHIVLCYLKIFNYLCKGSDYT